jgi:uncharacterized phage-associated protein
MVNVLDAAAYILEKRGPMTAMRLQKLVYYSQAWSIVWDDIQLFPEEIEAWKNGPVVRELWEKHRGQYHVDASDIRDGNKNALDEGQRETVDAVLQFYGDHSAQWLSDLTHLEDPWRDAWARGANSTITKEALAEYYSSIELPDEQKG